MALKHAEQLVLTLAVLNSLNLNLPGQFPGK